ncbi:MAG: hypothetical protein ACFFCS_01095 [Candidatus Hodarchaeota archaeon]
MQKNIKVIVVIGVCILIGGVSFVLIQNYTGNSGVGSPPVNPAVNVSFTDTDPDVLEIGGDIVITRAVNESDITHYVLYWGSDSSTKSGPAIAEIAKTGSDIIYPVAQNTSISGSTPHFLVYTKNDDGEMATGVNDSISDYITPTERLVNGGFESGVGIGWIQTDGSYNITMHSTEVNMEVRTGSWGAWHGGVTDYTDSHYQQVSISPNATVATFSYYYLIETTESGGLPYDYLDLYVNGNFFLSYSNLDDTASSWYYASIDLSSYIGQTILITFMSSNDNSDNTNFFIDDVSLLADD